VLGDRASGRLRADEKVNGRSGEESVPGWPVANTVSYVDLFFNEAVDPASVSTAAFHLHDSGGRHGFGQPFRLGAQLAPATVRVSFPAQNLLGGYSSRSRRPSKNIFGQPLAQAYTNGFTITLPTISGTVTDTNGAPVAGVLLQPNGGLIGSMTDSNGNYAIGVADRMNGFCDAVARQFYVRARLVELHEPSRFADQSRII